MRGPGPYARFGKRALDIVAASLGIVLLLPLGALVAALIWCALGSPVLFRQRRPGLHGVPFTLVKFRSMAAGYDSSGRRPAGFRTSDRNRALAPRHESRRDSRAMARPHRRDEPGRATAAAHEISAALHAGTSAQTRGAPRHHGTRSSEWPQRTELGRALRARRRST